MTNLSKRRNSKSGQELLYGVAAGADTIGDADAAIGVSGEGDAGELLAEAFDAVEAIEMSDRVLGHGGFPFINAAEQRAGVQTENLLQFVADDRDDFLVGKIPDILRVASGKEATEQSAVLRRAVRKFVVDEGGG